jgi:hypothetical protein
MCNQIAVEEFEHGLFLRDRLVTGDGSGDDHITTIVEGRAVGLETACGSTVGNTLAVSAAFEP